MLCPRCKSVLIADIRGGVISVNEDNQEYIEEQFLSCPNDDCDYSD